MEKAGFDLEIPFVDRNPKRSFLRFVILNCIQLYGFVTGGPDWTRTSDPALIKRML